MAPWAGQVLGPVTEPVSALNRYVPGPDDVPLTEGEHKALHRLLLDERLRRFYRSHEEIAAALGLEPSRLLARHIFEIRRFLAWAQVGRKKD